MKPLNIKKLPPLKSLKGFESAARLRSFRKAAEELSVTHPAITHQIHMLEQDLGVLLFDRSGRSVELTREGIIFYPVVREALETLIRGSESMRRINQSNVLRIQTYVTVSIRWLSRRLSKFRAIHPDAELRLISSVHEQSFDEENADIGLVFNRGEADSRYGWKPLFYSSLRPICSPDLVSGRSDLSIHELKALPLIHVTSEAWQWSDWFQEQVSDNNYGHKNLYVDSTAVALEMAMDGEGVMLINGPFAERDLMAGRLIIPCAYELENFGVWGLAYKKELEESPLVDAFLSWLKEEVGEM